MEYKVSELAEKAGVTKRTIHYYISKGLLLPPEGSGVNSVYAEFLVHQKENDLNLFERVDCRIGHEFAEFAVWLVDARRVDKYHLHAAFVIAVGDVCIDAANRIAGRLRLVRRNRDFFAKHRIEKRWFADIRSSDNSYKSCFH